MSKITVELIATHHPQNPLDLSRNIMFKLRR
jgi:hypothetical protein